MIVGLDLSLTATGVATPSGPCLVTPGKRRGMERLQYIRERVLSLAGGAELVVIEGYSYHSRSSRAHKLGELGGVVRLALWEEGIPYLDVPPSSLKRFATGSGNASKGLVLVEAVKRLGYPGADDNEADALWLREIGRHILGQDTVPLPKAHLTALRKLSDALHRRQ